MIRGVNLVHMSHFENYGGKTQDYESLVCDQNSAMSFGFQLTSTLKKLMERRKGQKDQ
jgi:hypothetical protein